MVEARSMVDCSVVVCTRSRPGLLAACLRSLAELDPAPAEILVVDNGPDASTRSVAEHARARYIVEPVRGLSRARNTGAAASSGSVIAYLDDDAVADPGWLGPLIEEFRDPDVLAVAGRILPSRLQTVAEQRFEAAGGFTRNRGRRLAVDRSTRGWFDLANFGGIGSGGNIAVRKSAFGSRWPGFDVRLGRGARLPNSEEHDAFFRLIAGGGRVVYVPDAAVRHPYPATMLELRRRHWFTVAGSGAYAARLLLEQPRWRLHTLGAIASWLSTPPASSDAAPEPIATVGETAAAFLAGFSGYAGWRGGRVLAEASAGVSAARGARTVASLA